MPTLLRLIATGDAVSAEIWEGGRRMDERAEPKQGRDRPVAYERCGGPFTCTLGGPCWCGQEEFRLPLTTEGGPADCLCPTCLRAYAEELRVKGLGPA